MSTPAKPNANSPPPNVASSAFLKLSTKSCGKFGAPSGGPCLRRRCSHAGERRAPCSGLDTKSSLFSFVMPRGNGTGRGRGWGQRGRGNGRGRGRSGWKQKKTSPYDKGSGGGASGSSSRTAQIAGFGDASYHEIVKFLNTNLNLKWTSLVKKGNVYVITVRSNEHMRQVIKLHGRNFKQGQKLQVKSGSSKQQTSQKTQGSKPLPALKKLPDGQRRQLMEELKKRWDGGKSMLNLKGLSRQHGSHFLNFSKNVSLVRHIGKEIRGNDTLRAVRTIDFSDNGIRSLRGFDQLANDAKQCVNLSFANNPIQSLDELKHLKGFGGRLKNLNLEPNPQLARILPGIKVARVRELFPRLENLSGRPAPDVIQFDLPENVTAGQLPPIKGNSLEEGAAAATRLVAKYITTFDRGDRLQLDEYYTRLNSCFSLTVSKNSTADYRFSGANRSLTQKDVKPEKLADLLKIGRSPIVVALRDLPQSFHDMSTFTTDSLILPSKAGATPACQVTIRGYFKESPTQRRAFHRTFIIGARDNRLILNDMLFVGDEDAIPAASESEVPKLTPEAEKRLIDFIQNIQKWGTVTPKHAYDALVEAKGDDKVAFGILKAKKQIHQY